MKRRGPHVRKRGSGEQKGTHRASVKKASSTPSLTLAEVSMNLMPSSSASCCPRSVETARFSSQSHLLPIRILLTPSVACCSTLENHVRMSVVIRY